MEGTYFKRRGQAPLAYPLAMTLVCVKVYGAGEGKISQTPAGADKKFQPSQDSVVERQQH